MIIRSCNNIFFHYLPPMARPLRLEFSGVVYHLTSCGTARQEISRADVERKEFLGS